MVVENLQITPLLEWLLGPAGRGPALAAAGDRAAGGGSGRRRDRIALGLSTNSVAPGPAASTWLGGIFGAHVAGWCFPRWLCAPRRSRGACWELHCHPDDQGPDAPVGSRVVRRRTLYLACGRDRPDGRGLCLRLAGWGPVERARRRARGNAASASSILPGILPEYHAAASSRWRGWRSAIRSVAAWWWSSSCSWS